MARLSNNATDSFTSSIHLNPKEVKKMTAPEWFNSKLPNSQQEIVSLLVVAVIAIFAAFARLMYGDDQITKRRIFGACLIAGLSGIGLYSGIILLMGDIAGYGAVFIGAMGGTFAEQVIRYGQRLLERKAEQLGLVTKETPKLTNTPRPTNEGPEE